MSTQTEFLFACPLCKTPLESSSADEMRCPADEMAYCQVNGVWNFFPPSLRAGYEKFIQDYEHVRREEGRGAEGPEFYRALPYQDLSGRFSADWQIRARSFTELLGRVVEPLEKRLERPLKVIDLGAGNGWLSYRLAQRGHHAAAVDLLSNSSDGLGAWIHYDAAFTPVQADFDHLPFQPEQIDLIIYNASLHYSTHYETTLRASWQLLRAGGHLAILDSPLYHKPDSGLQMVREREAHFQEAYGFPSNELDSENFLTDARLEALAQDLGTKWQLHRPFYNLEWELRPWKARLLGQREPARFALIAAVKKGEESV